MLTCFLFKYYICKQGTDIYDFYVQLDLRSEETFGDEIVEDLETYEIQLTDEELDLEDSQSSIVGVNQAQGSFQGSFVFEWTNDDSPSIDEHSN